MKKNYNILANLISQFYTVLVSLIVIPIYLKYMGAEAYGLIGFFTLIQTWLSLLDMGFGPTIGRCTSIARNSNTKLEDLIKLLRSIEVILFFLGLILVAIFSLLSTSITTKWLKIESLNSQEVSISLIVMIAITSLKWLATIYRSGLSGLEDQIFLSVINVVLATLKYIGVIGVIIFISPSINVFFSYQFLIALIEVSILGNRFYRIFPVGSAIRLGFYCSWHQIKSNLSFSLGIAYTSAIWMIISKLDLLVLSKALSLNFFGYYSLITAITGCLNIIATPIFLATSPQLNYLYSQNNFQLMIQQYKKMYIMVLFATFVPCLNMMVFSRDILYFFFNDLEVASWGKEIMVWSSLGSYFFTLGSIQFYLLNSLGKIKTYAVGTTLAIFIHVPFLLLMIKFYSIQGAAIAWFVFNFAWFVLFTSLVHKRYIGNFCLGWFKNILPIFALTGIFSYLFYCFFMNVYSASTIQIFFKMLFFTTSVILFLLISFSDTRLYINKMIARIIKVTYEYSK